MEHKSNCFAFVIKGINNANPLKFCFIKEFHESYFVTTVNIWHSKFYLSKKDAKSWSIACETISPNYNWKIQKVTLGSIEDV